MATITEKIRALNDADLSRLRAKLNGLRADLEKTLNAQKGKNAAPADTQDFLNELETARRRSA